MFDNPLVLPVILGVIALGIFYLIVTSQNDGPGEKTKDEKDARSWQVQCPSCRRWKKMPPIRREKLLNEQEALQRKLISGPRPRFLHAYKCQFCGHIWQENYSE
jgi:hypothetical protein